MAYLENQHSNCWLQPQLKHWCRCKISSYIDKTESNTEKVYFRLVQNHKNGKLTKHRLTSKSLIYSKYPHIYIYIYIYVCVCVFVQVLNKNEIKFKKIYLNITIFIYFALTRNIWKYFIFFTKIIIYKIYIYGKTALIVKNSLILNICLSIQLQIFISFRY